MVLFRSVYIGNVTKGAVMEREIEAALEELSSGWVELEVESADFGDERLRKRYARVLGQVAKMPHAAFTQSSECLSELLGAYRFIDNSKVTVEKLLAPHREQLSGRASGEARVLLIQDTSYLDFSDHFTCEDLQPMKLGRMQKALWLHATFCVLPNGLPLGIADAQYLTGNNSGVSGGSTRAIEEKLSRRWHASVDNCQNLFAKDVRKIWVCDREADIYELLAHIGSKGEDYVIRSKYCREIEEAPFFDMRHALEHAQPCGSIELSVTGTRTRAARKAQLEVKFVPATVVAPRHKQQAALSQSVPSYVVEASELYPPSGEEPIHWRLVTNLKVASFEDALEILTIYQRRWSIEELFRILKSGCRVEKAQFQSTARLSKYITLSLIVAWRIYFLVHLNRVNPTAPVETVLTATERDTLQLLIDDKRRRRKKQRRVIIRTAHQAISVIAQLGGYLDRKNDPSPGLTVLWRGTMALAFSAMTFAAYQRASNE